MNILKWISDHLIGGSGLTEGPRVTELTSIDQLHEALTKSSEHPLFLFKHSTACPISARAAARVDEYVQEGGADAPEFYLIKVIESRPVSNAIAQELGVTHASPQLLLVKDRKSVWDTSHGNIRRETIDEALEKFAAA